MLELADERGGILLREVIDFHTISIDGHLLELLHRDSPATGEIGDGICLCR